MNTDYIANKGNAYVLKGKASFRDDSDVPHIFVRGDCRPISPQLAKLQKPISIYDAGT